MDWATLESEWLAPYAARSAASRGRRFAEEAHPYRTAFQRDRERIIHCSAFRRLVGKTQVLVGRINDHHRTRLTHTLEVAQISRTMARRLRLNEDLTEAIALSHDLGHPPFGHAGEAALAECMHAHGGFDHNLYGLRRVDVLEERYPNFPGLNLSFEVREAFLTHSRPHDAPEAAEFLAAGSPLLEAQLVDAADSLAYDTHDIDDALGIGLITLTELDDIEIWRQTAADVRGRYPGLTTDQLRTAVVREMIARQAADLIGETERRVRDHRIESPADVRACGDSLVGLSAELVSKKAELERFLLERVYRHHQILRRAEQGKTVLRQLFAELVAKPMLLPERYLARWARAPGWVLARAKPSVVPRSESLERVVVDYLAGMTDRFARHEHVRLFHPNEDQ